MEKRGLSAVVTTLILILLVLVAVGIIWVTLNSFISKAVGSIGLGGFFLDFDIKNVAINNGDVSVTLTRGTGPGDLAGLKFVIFDGINSVVVEKPSNLQELSQGTFNISYSEISDLGFINKVSVAPVYKTQTMEEKSSRISDTYKVDEVYALSNSKEIVSWWRFNGNANDEISFHNGVIKNNANCNIVGKFGKACNFDGSSNYVEVSNSNDFLIDNGTIAFWFNPVDSSIIQGIFSKDASSYGTGGHLTIYLENSKVKADLQNISSDFFVETSPIENNRWHLVALSFGSEGMKLYVDGALQAINSSYVGGLGTSSGGSGNYEPLIIGAASWNSGDLSATPLDSFFKGKIDEIMIFNTSLDDGAIKSLYALDLS